MKWIINQEQAQNIREEYEKINILIPCTIPEYFLERILEKVPELKQSKRPDNIIWKIIQEKTYKSLHNKRN